MEIQPNTLFLKNLMSKQISVSFICFLVGILDRNDILIEVPKIN